MRKARRPRHLVAPLFQAVVLTGLLLGGCGLDPGGTLVSKTPVTSEHPSASAPSPTVTRPPADVQATVTAGLPTIPVPGKPRLYFEGELNGFLFYDSNGIDFEMVMQSLSPKCGCKGRGNNVRYAAEAEWQASPLAFDLAYVPAGVESTHTVAGACEDEIINVARVYYLDPAGSLNVLRQAGPPLIPVRYLRTELEPSTIGGRPALVVRSDHPLQRHSVLLRDDASYWVLSGMGLPVEELIKVAAGLTDTQPNPPVPTPADGNPADLLARLPLAFTGNLNGFEFRPSGEQPDAGASPTPTVKCDTTYRVAIRGETPGLEREGQPGDFTATYLPPDLAWVQTIETACDGEVTYLERVYGDTLSPQTICRNISITRKAGPAVVTRSVARERLVSSTIAGLPAVVAQPSGPNGRTIVYLRDDFGLWVLDGCGLSLQEIVRVAEGLR